MNSLMGVCWKHLVQGDLHTERLLARSRRKIDVNVCMLVRMCVGGGLD